MRVNNVSFLASVQIETGYETAKKTKVFEVKIMS